MKLLDRVIQNSYFVFHKPAMILPLLGNYLRMGLSGNVLRTVDIVPDYRCNLKCLHCYATDFGDDDRDLLSLPDLFRVVDLCFDEGAVHFNVIGGEPTLRRDLFALIAYMHRKPSIISLATNGWIIDVDYASRLKDAGLDLVLLSLDSMEEAEHDRIRAKNSYGRAMNALESCLKVGLKVYVSTVITKDMMRDGRLKALERFCDDKKLLLHVNLPALFGRWKNNTEMFFGEDDQRLVEKMYKERSVRSCEMSAYGPSQCRSGKEKLHITAYGDVMPCTFIPISFGNILQEKLDAIRQRMLNFPFLRDCHPMCIPSTHEGYFQYMKEKLASCAKVPIPYEEVLRDLQGAHN